MEPGKKKLIAATQESLEELQKLINHARIIIDRSRAQIQRLLEEDVPPSKT